MNCLGNKEPVIMKAVTLIASNIPLTINNYKL